MTTVYPYMYLRIAAMKISGDCDGCVSTASDHQLSYNLRVGPHEHRSLVCGRVRMPHLKI
jgi:hypothetical protein